jgi:hypothetical protein
MRRSDCSVLLVGVSFSALLLASTAVRADGYGSQYGGPCCAPDAIIRSNNQISADFAATNFDYSEAIGDKEKGWVPGLSITGSWMGTFYGVHPYLWGRFTWLSGSTDYSATSGPVLKNTDGADVKDEDFRIGLGFNLAKNVMLTPYVGLGWNDWNRNLSGPHGYHEEYTNGYVGGGLLLQVSPINRLVLSANGLVGSTFDASMNASDTPGGFPLPPFSPFNLGSSTLYMVGGSADYAITNMVHANVGVDYTNFQYGQSQVQFGAYEPNSRTFNVTVRVGLGIAFGRSSPFRL